MGRTKIAITGDEKVLRKMMALSNGAKRVIRDVLGRGAEIYLREARNRAPVDQNLGISKKGQFSENRKNPVGLLKANLGKQVWTGREAIIVWAGMSRRVEWYGKWLYYGTKQRYHKKTGKYVGFINSAKHDFLTPSWVATRNKVDEYVNRAGRDRILKLLK